MDLGIRHVSNERFDQYGIFTLADEWTSCRSHGLGARYTHTPPEERGELANKPLNDVVVVEQLNERDEKYNWWDHANQEPVQFLSLRAGKESNAISGKSKEVGS